jgi:Icc protein
LSKRIVHDRNPDGIDRRGFLQRMAWAGTGVVWTVGAGVLSSQAFGQNTKAASGEPHFVRIGDSHMGFNKPANPDVVGTLKATVDKTNALPLEPEFVIHTGDLSHTSKPADFRHVGSSIKRCEAEAGFLCAWRT